MRKPSVLAIVLGALIGSLALCGCNSTSVTTSTSTKVSTPGTSAGRGTSGVGGLVQMTSYSDNDGPNSTVVVTGAVGDYGEGVRTYANGVVTQQYNRLDVELTHGSFLLEIAGLEQRLVSAFTLFPTSLNTCSGSETVMAMTPIVPESGTGAYKGISGSLQMTVSINEVDSWPKCPRSGQTRLLTQTVFATGSGTVSFK